MNRITFAARCAYRALRGRPVLELIIPPGSWLTINGEMQMPDGLALVAHRVGFDFQDQGGEAR